MKIFMLVAGMFFFTVQSSAQYKLIDSLYNALRKEKTDTGKAIILYKLSHNYQVFKPDSALLLAQKAYSLSIKTNFLKGQSWALNQMADAFNRMGNYTQALEYFIRQLKIEEKREDPYNIAATYMNIALLYNNEKDAGKAVFYAFKADSVIKKNNLAELTLYNLLNLGEILEKANKIQPALSYTLECYRESLKKNDSLMVGTALNNLGNIYSKMGNTEQAVSSYQRSAPYLDSMGDDNTLSECTLGLAKVFEKKGLTDSARYFASQSYKLSFNNEFLNHALDASSFLSQLYKKENNIDSAFTYQQIMVDLKDSIQSSDKIKLLQSMTIEEQLRQQQMAEALEQEKEDQRQKLQLLAIGILVPIFFLISVYISRKKVHKRIIEFSGILSILLLFEYITLLIHPFIADKTNHSPFLEIIIFVTIAAIITPSHHKIQALLISRLTKIHEGHTLSRRVAVEENTNPENGAE